MPIETLVSVSLHYASHQHCCPPRERARSPPLLPLAAGTFRRTRRLLPTASAAESWRWRKSLRGASATFARCVGLLFAAPPVGPRPSHAHAAMPPHPGLLGSCGTVGYLFLHPFCLNFGVADGDFSLSRKLCESRVKQNPPETLSCST